ncbi:MAG: rhodanese-like domain-containing protein [Spirochaetes bacterium]|nr:rhodanese-like domain-containing protein [Spirochaetota bacterium]
MTDFNFLSLPGITVLAAVFIIFSFIRRLIIRADVSKKLKAGAKVIDVRDKSEFSGGHFKGAINIPVDSISGNLKSIGSKEGVYVIYCVSGSRSAAACRILKKAGFNNVTNAGGLSHMPKV